MKDSSFGGMFASVWQRRLPVVLQSEASECGLACLAMVASALGHQVDLVSLRQRHPISIKGMTLSQLISVAEKLDLASRPVRLDMIELNQLSTPCILHWEFDHFVVLERMTRTGAVIHDPSIGRRHVDNEALSKAFTGVALELKKGESFKQIDDRLHLRLADFWGQLSGIRGVLVQLLLLSVMLQAFALASPFYMQLVVDEAITGEDQSLLKALALGFLLLACIQVFTSTLRSWVSLYVGSQLSFQFTANLFRHLLRLPPSYFQKRHMGDIVSRFGSMAPVQDMLTSGLVGMVLDGVLAVTTLILIFMYSKLLASIVLLALALTVLLKMALFFPERALTQESLVLGAREDSHFMESIRAINALKLSGNERNRFDSWQNLFGNALNNSIKLGKLAIVGDTLLSLIVSTEVIVLIFLGGKLAIEGGFSVGMLYAFMAYRGHFNGAVSGFVDALFQLRMLRVHLDRVADIALAKPDKLTESGADAPVRFRLKGSLELSAVSFSHTALDPPVVKNVSLSIAQGESVAIVGVSGCGKTTLLKLLIGLERPSAGSIWVDGKRLTPQLYEYYWRQIGVVMQDDQLVSGTIADNIILKVGQNSEKRLELAAKIACVYEDIVAMPMGFHTFIGEMGSALSGGQKQRILLARALYSKPRMLFLDEATSHLDTHLEARIAQHLKKMDITRIVVAHRPQSIDLCDRVIRLQDGEVSNDSLLNSKEQTVRPAGRQ